MLGCVFVLSHHPTSRLESPTVLAWTGLYADVHERESGNAMTEDNPLLGGNSGAGMPVAGPERPAVVPANETSNRIR